LAAKEAGIEVPINEIPKEIIDRAYTELENDGRSGDEFIEARDDYSSDPILKELVSDCGIMELATARKLLNLEETFDPVTYDDNGNVIPLSQMFNPQKNDIRYLHDGERIVGSYNRGTGEVKFAKGASVETVLHELGWHAARH
jgi:hypothetical protein